MKENAFNILGINIGARQIGVSVSRGGELIFYAVKSIKGGSRKETLERLEKTLIRLIDKYCIEIVAVEEIVYQQQHGSFVKKVYDQTKNFIRKKNIRFLEYDPITIKRIVCRSEKPTKRNTALILALKYTELARYFNVPKLWQKRYFAQLFSAIAVALVCGIETKEISKFSATGYQKEISNVNY